MSITSGHRAPLLDPRTYAALRNRSIELLGLVLIAASVAIGAALWTYSLEDPSWFAASTEPARNIFGSPGAGIANPLIMICGLTAWGIPVAAGCWGIRLLLHIGDSRILYRAPVVPIAIVISSIFLSSNVSLPIWSEEFGMGGLFGDAMLRLIVRQDLLEPGLELTVITASFAVLALTATVFSLGVSRGELVYSLNLLLFAYGVCLRSIAHVIVRPGSRWGERQAPHSFEPPIRRQDRRVAAMTRTENPVEFDSEPERPGFWARAGRFVGIGRRSVDDTGQPGRFGQPAAGAGLWTDTETDMGPASEDAGTASESGSRSDDANSVPGELRLGPAPPRMAQTDSSAREQSPLVRGMARSPNTASERAKSEAQPSLFPEKAPGDYVFPPLGLLATPTNIVRRSLSNEALEENARMLENVLDDYGIKGEIISVRPGPVVTLYELEPAPGLKASRIIGLADDIARSMSALSARVSTIPGRSVIGIELPNIHREKVLLNEILSTKDFGDGKSLLPLALGKDIGGSPFIADLSRMPHLLIAGTTGSGKSVAINTMILSLLYKLSPDACRLIMIDPKMLELSVYDGIPHLMSPVVTDPKKAVVALKWVVAEMEDRYRKMSWVGVRNIHGYNARIDEALASGQEFTRTVQTGFDSETGEPILETQHLDTNKLPFIVVVVDEMADLMMVAGKEIEACIQRLSQMARASGIHLIMATQRPSVDVITGTIKANFPTRISFQVTSRIDSRTIIGEMGAEQLLGTGDMLYMAGGGKITRIHSPFVSDSEVESVVSHLKEFGPPEYVNGVVEGLDEATESEVNLIIGRGNDSGKDDLYAQAVEIVASDRKCSTSYIQRKLSIGYNKAARLVEQMEDEGLVSPANHVGKREILIPEP